MTQSGIGVYAYSGVVCDKKRKPNNIDYQIYFTFYPCAYTWINDRKISFHITAFHSLVARRGEMVKTWVRTTAVKFSNPSLPAGLYKKYLK